ITIWIFSFSEMQLRYSTECKQYICDVTVALIIVAYSLWQSKRTFRPVIAATLGIVAPWLSMASVFVLTGTCIVFIWTAWVKNVSIFLIFGIPVLVCILASGFEVYSLVPRMILWAFTLLLMLQGLGWQWITDRMPVYLNPALIIVVIAVAGLQNGWQVFYRPL